MRKIVFTAITCLFLFNLHAQTSNVDHWETIIHADTVFRYVTSNDALTDVDWRNNGYDDSAWHEGRGGIGYGDSDDNTVIEGIGSVFLRRTFEIIDAGEIAAAVLNIDYDDAFVAYLNGVEIARSGGLSSSYPDYDEFSSLQHEAILPQGGTPSNILLDNELLSDNLLDGINVLAVQVHNANSTSSDLSSNVWMTLGLNISGTRYLVTPAWFVAPLGGFSSNLPVLVIETEDGRSIPDEPKINAHLGIVYNGPGQRNSSDGPFLEYDGHIGIEIRGNSSANFPKKPYNIETRDESGENLNVSLLGLPEENDWVLRSSYIDHTFIRNALADYMARQTGYWASRTRHVEVILNGEYQGIYVFMEKLKRDDNRLDIARLDPTDISGEDLTGGYIWEVTGFANDFGENRKLKYPDIDDVLPVQLNYIQSVDNAFRNKMRQSSSTYGDPDNGYVQHIWVESFIYEMIVQEAMRNGDAYGWSGYYHKDKNELINAGPVWDFDQSSGNSTKPDNGVVPLWLAEHPDGTNLPFFWSLLLHDPYFQYSLSLRWKELRADKFADDKLIGYIDSIAMVLDEAQAREFEKWPVLGEYIWRETTGYQERDTYQKEVDYLKDFLIQRWQWMDGQLADIPKPSGYPSMSVREDALRTTGYLATGRKYIDLDEVFVFPYTSDLKYNVIAADPSILVADVKKTDSVKLDLLRTGSCELYLQATDTYGNKKDTTIIFQVVEGSDPESTNYLTMDAAHTLYVYPNPAGDHITIRFEGDGNTFEQVRIYTVTGQLVEDIYNGNGIRNLNYNCGRLDNGIYFIRIQTAANQVYTRKLLIQR